MANRYWVGGTGYWTGTDTSHWSTSSGGTGGASVPLYTDDVFFDTNSFTATGQTVTMYGYCRCRHMNWTGARFTPTLAQYVTGSHYMDVYGSVTLISDMNLTTYARWTFYATTSGQTINMAGLSVSAIIFQGVGGVWTLQSDIICRATMLLTKGTLNTNGYTVTISSYLECSSSYANTLNLGASTINALYFRFGNPTYNIVNAGTSTLVQTGEEYYSFTGYNHTFYKLKLSGGYIFNANTFNEIEFVPGYSYFFPNGSTTTVNTLTGTGTYNKGIILRSLVDDAPFTLSISSSIERSYYAFKDCTKTGAGAITVSVGHNMGNNSNITFIDSTSWDATKRYWVGGSGNWSDATNHWSGLSGQLPGAPVPNDYANVVFDANSFSAAGQTVTINTTAYCLDMDWTGATNSPTLTGSSTLNLYGSLTLIANMTYSYTGTIGFWSTATGRTITTADKAITNSSWQFYSIPGEWKLQDNLIFSGAGYISIQGGTLDFNNKNVSCTYLYATGSNAKTIKLGDGVVTLTKSSGGSTVGFDTATSLTILPGGSLIVSPAGGNFKGGGCVFNNIEFQGSPATITGSNTFNDVKIADEVIVNFTAGTTQNISSLSRGEDPKYLAVIQSTTSGCPFTLSKLSGTIEANYYSIKDCTATGGAVFKALNSLNVGGNSGWNWLMTGEIIIEASAVFEAVGERWASAQSLIIGQTTVEVEETLYTSARSGLLGLMVMIGNAQAAVITTSNMQGQANAVVAAVKGKLLHVEAQGYGTLILAIPSVKNYTQSELNSLAMIEAEGIAGRMSGPVSLTCKGIAEANINQRMGGQSDIEGDAALGASTLLGMDANATMSGDAETGAHELQLLFNGAGMTGTTDLETEANQRKYSPVALLGATKIYAPGIKATWGLAQIAGEGAASANTLIRKSSGAEIISFAELQTRANQRKFSGAGVIGTGQLAAASLARKQGRGSIQGLATMAASTRLSHRSRAPAYLKIYDKKASTF